jgi:intracellular multiplication protein IcmP
MAAGGGGGAQGDDKNAYNIIWIVTLVFVIGWVIWHFFSYQLKTAFLKIRLFEAMMISLFSEQGDLIQNYIHNLDVYSLDLQTAGFLSNLVGSYLMYPILLLLVCMVAHLLLSHTNVRYTKPHDMNSLVKQEQKNWPQISPVVNLDLVKEDISKGPWAMAMTPMQFVKKYKLISVEIVPDRKSPWKADGVYKMILDKEKARWILINQLGPLWPGIDKLPQHVLAVFAVLAARIEHDGDSARAMIRQLAASSAKGTVDYTGSMQLLNKYVQSKAVKRAIERHAYVYTVMATMLELARSDGVQAAADLLWVKPIDRKLWYMLNSVGRYVAVPEVAGPFSHWRTEKELGRSLSVPQVDMALKGLEEALTVIQYVPGEDEEIPLVESSAT